MTPDNFWRNFNVKDIVYFRENRLVRETPLFDIHTFPEYESIFIRTINSFRNTNIWNSSICPSDKGYIEKCYDIINCGGKKTTPGIIRSNYEYFTYLDICNKSINKYEHIFEIGAGCGDFCKFILDNGFTGNYYIIDIPNVIKISSFFLNEYKVNFLNTLPSSIPKNSLLISTWGLSEIPIQNRNINQEKFSGGLIIYQDNIFQNNNTEYFSTWKGYRIPMDFLKWDGGSEFLIW